MIRLLVLLTAVVAALARESPNAGFVENLVKSQSGVRFSDNILEDAVLDAPGLIAKYGYPYEIHNVITSDGYILEMHRIPHGRDRNNKPGPRPVAFVMHGLLSSSADFLVLGPGNALAYVLAEAGYDVWLGNARGNYYSRRNTRLNPDSILTQNFWKFSWDEIGSIDLPTFIDYILARTGQKKLHYIGHSQGGTTFLVLNSLKPEYNDKIITFQGLAPASYFDNNAHLMFQVLAPFESILESAAFNMRMGEIFGNREFMQWFGTTFCNGESIVSSMCTTAFGFTSDPSLFNATMVPIFLGHSPAGASIRQVAHYGQCIKFNRFQRYNHGTLQNLVTYGSRTPPEYDLSKITAPAYLHYGLEDLEVDYKDIYILAERLGNTVGLYRADRPSFNHYDFIWGMDVKVQIYDKVIALMKDADRREK